MTKHGNWTGSGICRNQKVENASKVSLFHRLKELDKGASGISEQIKKEHLIACMDTIEADLDQLYPNWRQEYESGKFND